MSSSDEDRPPKPAMPRRPRVDAVAAAKAAAAKAVQRLAATAKANVRADDDRSGSDSDDMMGDYVAPPPEPRASTKGAGKGKGGGGGGGGGGGKAKAPSVGAGFGTFRPKVKAPPRAAAAASDSEDDDDFYGTSRSRDASEAYPDLANPRFFLEDAGPLVMEDTTRLGNQGDKDEDMEPRPEEDRRPTLTLPASINRYLMNYQRTGVKWFVDRYNDDHGGILGDDMGLGKTVQCAAFLAAFLGKTGTNADKTDVRAMRRASSGGEGGVRAKKKVLIVVPVQVCPNWVSELDRWGHFAFKEVSSNTCPKADRAPSA